MIGGSVSYWERAGRLYSCGFTLVNPQGMIRRVTIKANHIEKAKLKVKRLHPGFRIKNVVSQILQEK